MSAVSHVKSEAMLEVKVAHMLQFARDCWHDGISSAVVIGHVSAAHRPCNQPHPVLLDHVHGHGRVPAYRHAKCRDVSPRCPCKSNEHEPPVLVQGRYDLLGSITHTVKGFRTHTMVGLAISAMREWPGIPKREASSAKLHETPFSCGQSVERPFRPEFDTGDEHPLASRRSFKREVSRSKMAVRDQGSLLVNVIGFAGDGNWTTMICSSSSKLLCLGSASISRFSYTCTARPYSWQTRGLRLPL
jgi:hypothetical protein